MADPRDPRYHCAACDMAGHSEQLVYHNWRVGRAGYPRSIHMLWMRLVCICPWCYRTQVHPPVPTDAIIAAFDIHLPVCSQYKLHKLAGVHPAPLSDEQFSLLTQWNALSLPSLPWASGEVT